MGAPPGFGPKYSEREIKERKEHCEFEKLEAWEKRRRNLESNRRNAQLEHEAALEEDAKRDMDIFRNGDLVKNTLDGEAGVIVEAGYRSHVEVLADGTTVKWPRRHIEVIND